jgi:hypothetical protein
MNLPGEERLSVAFKSWWLEFSSWRLDGGGGSRVGACDADALSFCSSVLMDEERKK